MTAQILTQEYLKEILHYNPETGIFTWAKAGPKKSLYSEAGSRHSCGKISATKYIKIGIDRTYYRAHRLAWLYVHGEWPEDQIDHVNGDGTDNRLINLRSVNGIENHKNRRIYTSNKSGVSGVHLGSGKKWRATITINGKVKVLGSYIDIFEAYCARLSALNKSDYHSNHGSNKPY